MPEKETLTELMGIALPTTGSRMIGSLSWFLEPIVVAQSLAIAGVTTSIATKTIRRTNRICLTTFNATFLSNCITCHSLVPAVSEANSTGNLRFSLCYIDCSNHYILLSQPAV